MTTWTTSPGFTRAQVDTWKSKTSGIAEDPFDFKGVAETPDDLHLLPEDLDIFPEQIQVDSERWETNTPISTAWVTLDE